MSDGVSTKYGLIICTDNYSVPEVVRFINILIIRYDLNCSVHYCLLKGLPRIYIKASSLNKLRTIIIPHIIPFSLYKLLPPTLLCTPSGSKGKGREKR